MTTPAPAGLPAGRPSVPEDATSDFKVTIDKE
jgi:hypothetical protein